MRFNFEEKFWSDFFGVVKKHKNNNAFYDSKIE